MYNKDTSRIIGEYLNTYQTFTPRGLAESRNLNLQTVRSYMTVYRKIGRVKRRSDGVWEVIQPIPHFCRKYVSQLAYCSGKKTQLYALTFEDNIKDRERFLLDVIQITFDMKCGNFIDIGYSQMNYYEPVKASQIYPLYEVGEL